MSFPVSAPWQPRTPDTWARRVVANSSHVSLSQKRESTTRPPTILVAFLFV
jgi:hypothetical protein